MLRQNQYDCFRDEKKVEYLRKWVVSQKIESQIQFFTELAAEPEESMTKRDGNWFPYKVREGFRRSVEGMLIHLHTPPPERLTSLTDF